MEFRIDQPYWLLLFIPIGIYMFYTWKSFKKSRSGKVLFYLRSAAILLLLFALSSPYVKLRVSEEQILFLVDRSVSVEGAGKQADEWINESLKSRKAHQSIGIYSFAGSFRADVPLTAAQVSVPVVEPMEGKDSTDIAKAMDLASAIGKRDRATRLVLLSDGLETTGSIDNILSKYSSGNIQIDTVLLENPLSNEAAIELFETPIRAFEGERQLLRMEVSSSSKTAGTLLVFQNDQEIIRESIELEPGNNAFSFHTSATGSGMIKYEAKLIVPDDAYLENNEMFAMTKMTQSPNVLIVQTDRNPSVIPTLLDRTIVNVEVVEASHLPEAQSSYLQYDAIIFDNVPGHFVGEQKMMMIEQTVKNFGTGFIMVGGEESFGLGGYFKSPIERLLPVEMEVKGKEQIPSLGLIIVLDRSGSMAGNKIALAREAAARSVELLRDDDTFGFTAFDDRVWEVIPVGPLTDREEAIDQILSIPAGGGTNIFPGVEKAYEALADLKLQRKHIILLTDGQSEMPPGYEELIEAGKENSVTLTTVAIGSDADGNLLEDMAESGGGRFYNVIDESTIPAILTRETSMMTRTYIVDDPFYMQVGNVPEWTALFSEGVPQMNAYIATTAKRAATIVGESPQEDPIIAEWMYGLGRTVAFTSDSTGKWTGDFARWAHYPEFWNTALTRVLPNYEVVPYVIKHERGGTFTITDSTRKAAFLEVAVVNENGQEVPFTSEPLAPGKLRVTVDAKPGLVFFSVSDDKGGLSEAGVSIPYSEEYKLKAPNINVMEKIADRTGGELLENPSEAFRSLPAVSSEKRPITNWLVLTAMILFFLDITLRRFGFFKTSLGNREHPVVQEEPTVAEGHLEQLLKSKKRR
ncbi:VWA domain-containing protein [Sporosarcina sp. HYO08]|uniref:VWA domain-containing protein n=1 Tax=Sporosarcina sp. HYO08 TaxID=1759557 RepID=UPI000793650D|nr:VWA domain-containing protein [Sporosarcina sp. HYO08]KXH79832.1 hypothetical protein AU377_10140 [Sporosarcina sp. HYO08]